MVQQKKKFNQKQLQLLQQLNTDEDLAKLWKLLISDAIDNALFEELPMEDVKVERAVINHDEEIATKLSMALSMRSAKNKISKKQKKQLKALAKESSAATLWRVLFSSSFLAVLCDDYTGIPLPSVPTTGSDISEISGTSRALTAISSHASALNPAPSNVSVLSPAASNVNALNPAASNVSALSRAASNVSALGRAASNVSALGRAASNGSADFQGVEMSESRAAGILSPARSNVSAGSRGVLISEEPASIVASRSHASNGGILKSMSSHASVAQKEIIADALNNDEEFQQLWQTAVQETLPKMLEDEYDLSAKSYVDFNPQVKIAVAEAQEHMGDYRTQEENLMNQEALLGEQLAREAANKADAAALRITDVFKVNKAKKQRIRLNEKKVEETRQLQSISEAVERAQADDEERQGDEGFIEIMDYKTRTVLMWSNRKAPDEEDEDDDAGNTEVVIVRKGGKGKKKNKQNGASEDSHDIKKSASKKNDLKNTLEPVLMTKDGSSSDKDIKKSTSKKSDLKNTVGSVVGTGDVSTSGIPSEAASKQASIVGSMSNVAKSSSKATALDEELVDAEGKGTKFKLKKKRSYALGMKKSKSKAE